MSTTTTYLVETFLTLVGVVVLAVLVLYGARRLGIGRPIGPLELVGRLPLDGRRVIYLVRVGRAAYVVGASERGLTRLGELDAVTLTPVIAGGSNAPEPNLTSSAGAGVNASQEPTKAARKDDAAQAPPTSALPSFADVLARRGRHPEGGEPGDGRA